MLKAVYPDYNWMPWRFKVSPKGVSKDPNVLAMALDFAQKELEISDSSDWYRISMNQLKDIGIEEIIKQNGGLFFSLTTARPTVNWEQSSFRTP